jgi:ornithine cyclodeaminase/alanine dehydrogenase-like protein (mu-crystallin family)
MVRRADHASAWQTSRRHPQEISMIDHIGFPVSDYPRSKAFYEKALAPLG